MTGAGSAGEQLAEGGRDIAVAADRPAPGRGPGGPGRGPGRDPARRRRRTGHPASAAARRAGGGRDRRCERSRTAAGPGRPGPGTRASSRRATWSGNAMLVRPLAGMRSIASSSRCGGTRRPRWARTAASDQKATTARSSRASSPARAPTVAAAVRIRSPRMDPDTSASSTTLRRVRTCSRTMMSSSSGHRVLDQLLDGPVEVDVVRAAPVADAGELAHAAAGGWCPAAAGAPPAWLRSAGPAAASPGRRRRASGALGSVPCSSVIAGLPLARPGAAARAPRRRAQGTGPPGSASRAGASSSDRLLVETLRGRAAAAAAGRRRTARLAAQRRVGRDCSSTGAAAAGPGGSGPPRSAAAPAPGSPPTVSSRKIRPDRATTIASNTTSG